MSCTTAGHVSENALQRLSMYKNLLSHCKWLEPKYNLVVWSKFLDETSGLTGREASQNYLVENDPESVPVSLPPVSAEQLFPAGKILQMEERPSCR